MFGQSNPILRRWRGADPDMDEVSTLTNAPAQYIKPLVMLRRPSQTLCKGRAKSGDAKIAAFERCIRDAYTIGQAGQGMDGEMTKNGRHETLPIGNLRSAYSRQPRRTLEDMTEIDECAPSW